MIRKERNPFASEFADKPTISKKSSLSWEESALDSRSSVEGFSNAQDTTRGVLWIPVLVVMCFCILLGRLVHLQIMQGSNYRALADGNRLRERIVLAPRGFITDAFGNKLAQNTVSFRLVAIPLDLPKDGLDVEVANLASMMGLQPADIQAIIAKADRRSFEPVTIVQDITKEQSILFATRSTEFIGFQVNTTPIREYIDPEMFSHVLGYAGLISDDELKENATQKYSQSDYIGKTGIELQYESWLRGKNGFDQIEVDASGKVIKTLGTVDPVAGNTVELSIDKELQEKLYAELSSKGTKGAAIAMDSKTGHVLALVSTPGYNNNLFAHGIKQDEYQALLGDKNLPLFNRAISGTYPPGSTIKLVGALAALQEGVVTENTVITDKGVLVIPNQYDSRISYNFYGWKRGGLGAMTVRSAIAESSDIYFYIASGGHPSSPIKGLGAERLAEYYRRFGMGSTTGIDLHGEKPGVVADPSWKASFYKNDPLLGKWYLGDTYHIGIGQGDMLVTPLQVAMWTATIANNGLGMKPQLLQKVITQDGKTITEAKPEPFIHAGVSEKNMRIVQEGMRQTVLSGSGRALASLPMSAAGKTGTSQFDGSDPSRTHAWFTSYAPFEDPQIVITVLVEAGGEGHVAAVPVAKNTLQWWAEHRYKK